MKNEIISIDPKNKIKLTEYLQNFRYIYIYGAGKNATRAANILEKNHQSIEGFVVSDMYGNPDIKLDYLVKQIDEIHTVDSETLFILGMDEKYHEEVKKILLNFGFTHILILSKAEKWKKNINIPKLEITAKIGCSIQCKYCPQALLYQAYFQNDKNRCREMEFESFKKCIEHMPRETVITFAGFVEPFFHPQGVEMLLYADRMGHPIELYTTFVGLSVENFKRIKDIPYREVVLHTPDEKFFANIPMTDEYCKVLDMALSHNKMNGEPFIDSANCQSDPSQEFLQLSQGRIIVESSLIDRAGALEDEILRKKKNITGEIGCYRSANTNHWVLLPDGDVVLCCMDFGLKHNLGNLIEHDYEYIIHDKPYQQFRQDMKGENGQGNHILCRNCTSAYQISKE